VLRSHLLARHAGSARARWRVAALDLAGHGESGHEREFWTLDALAGDVVAVADASPPSA
jgi:pimeloyl-ACP methyl ester carboxylesterase